MIFKNFVWLFVLVYPTSNLAALVFPLVFDTSCFVRIVYDGNLNSTSLDPIKISSPLETNPTTETTISYTIQDVSNFSFAFDVEDIQINDQPTIFDGYFPFFSKHYRVCDVFILLTETFNSTTAAIQQSGYGNSDDAIFLVVVDSTLNNPIITGFLSDFSYLETVSFTPIYSSVAFVPLLEYDSKSETSEMVKVHAYCYRCPEKLHELRVNSDKVERIPIHLSIIRSECKRLKNNGWNTKALLVVAGHKTLYKRLLSNLDERIGNVRKRYMKHLTESYLSQYILFRMALDKINMTFDSNIQRLPQAMDLAWILLDMEFWRRHPRKILTFYILGAMFFHWSYDSGMSTDFIDFDFPVYCKEMFDKGYRIWDYGVSTGITDKSRIRSFIPDNLSSFIKENTGMTDIGEIYYMNPNYNFSENVQDRLKSMADKKLLLLNGVESSARFTSLYMTLSTTKRAVLEEEFVCGILHQFPSTSLRSSHYFLIRGYLSRKFTAILESFLEAGLVAHLQGLITLQSSLKLMLRVDDLHAALSSSTLGVRTPLMIVCTAYMALSFTFWLVFVGSIMYANRDKVTTILYDFIEMNRKWSRNKVEVRYLVKMSVIILLLFLITMCSSSPFPSVSTLPITFDENCFIRIILEQNPNSTLFNPFQRSISSPIHVKTGLENIKTYMIHDLSNFNYAFDVEDVYINDELTLSDGYFRFFSKHNNSCNVFLLLTSTFNGTATAIQQSGYGTDTTAIFLVVVECFDNFIIGNKKRAGFLEEFISLESVSLNAFYPNLAFLLIPELQTSQDTTEIARIYAFCYYCPQNIQEIHIQVLRRDQISINLPRIRAECEQCNDNGWTRKILILAAAPPPVYKALIKNIDHKIGNGRKELHLHLTESYIAEYLLFRMVSDIINMTIESNLREHHADDDPETYWHLSIKAVDTFLPKMRNIVSVTRGSYMLTTQEPIKLIYCMEATEAIKIKWDIYFRILDLASWLCLLTAVFWYSFIYHSFTKAIDLVWILFDIEFWQQHPRIILAPYLLGAMFLPWIYDSGMSTDFIDFDFPIYIRDIVNMGYKIWDIDVTDDAEALQKVRNFVPQSDLNFLEENTGTADLEKILYIQKNFKLPNDSHGRLESMAGRKLLFATGAENSFTFPSLFVTLSGMKHAVVDRDFLCGTVYQSPTHNYQITQSFYFRGYMSTKFTNILERFVEAGFVKYLQRLITLQSALKSMPRVDDLNVLLSSSTLGVRTPLGVICTAYIGLNLGFLVLFVGTVFYQSRLEVCITTRKLTKGDRFSSKVQRIDTEGFSFE
ncbi:unnamed protein product [Orchesella dallaii]|uniref:Uncharacterized protein n=1 Tax=Orchesella dallaii TaxID=48710 RepID=A0ABP1R6K8_9HEXA